MFASLPEVIEITTILRGVERWQPDNISVMRISQTQMKPKLKKVLEEKATYNSRENSRIVKIVSGGQTGADRGGLDAAIALGIPHGGYCPKGRLAEDGTVPAKYNLTETGSKN
ncbi:MAG TPA: putative molybdenum carrier protein, partial [Victivallales bacterium]|nr:putative molybdenum carrier protein [Victivallales bacterium]